MARKRRGRPLSGVIFLDKPQGISSNQALQKVRRLFNAAKAGHTGNLDPMATGVLPICLGEATKFSSFGLDADKGYRTKIRLGQATTTGDAEGELIAEHPLPVLNEAQIRQVLTSFIGELEQVPPMYSALKINGQPLYKLARQGIQVERKRRQIRIDAIEFLAWQPPELEIQVACSKGTYIRTLGEDIGSALDCAAHLTALRRTHTGPWNLTHTVTLAELENLAPTAAQLALASEAELPALYQTLDASLHPTDVLIADLPRLDLSASQGARILHGQSLSWAQVQAEDANKNVKKLDLTTELGQDMRLYAAGLGFIGLGHLAATGQVAPKRLCSTPVSSHA